MSDFDKKLKEMSQNMEIPETYNQRVDDVLQSLPEMNAFSIKKKQNKRNVLRFAVCVLLVICILVIPTQVANANIFSEFKQTLMEFFHIGEKEASDDYGVESDRDGVVSKPDLFFELKEKIIDKHSIYLLVSITAPTDIEFNDKIGFDYFAFSEGSNYNADNVIGGGRDCQLLEVKEDKPNVATFVVSIVTDAELDEDTEITACFKDMMLDPYGDNPKMLVEGMWSLTFSVNYTVSENKTIEGTKDMVFTHDAGKVQLSKLELSPLGILVSADVTELHYADNAYSNATSFAVTLEMVDGTKLVIASHDPDEPWYTSMGSDSFEQPDGREIMTSQYEFEEMVDIGKVIGVYVEDLYIPLVE